MSNKTISPTDHGVNPLDNLTSSQFDLLNRLANPSRYDIFESKSRDGFLNCQSYNQKTRQKLIKLGYVIAQERTGNSCLKVTEEGRRAISGTLSPQGILNPIIPSNALRPTPAPASNAPESNAATLTEVERDTPTRLPESVLKGADYLSHYIVMLMREAGLRVEGDNYAEIDDILKPAFRDLLTVIAKLEARIAALESKSGGAK